MNEQLASQCCQTHKDELERKLSGHIGQEVNKLLASESLKELLASGPHKIVFDLLEEMAASVHQALCLQCVQKG